MKRVNRRLLALLVLILMGGAAGLALLHRFQVRRNAETMAVEATKRIDAGREGEAIELLAKYLNLRPGDAPRQRQYAELLLRQAESGRVTPRSAQLTIGAMETAMRAFPEDDALRLRFATFLLAVNQPGPAHDHFRMLMERLVRAQGGAARPAEESPDGGDGALDTGQIALRFAVAAAAVGRFDEAENALAALVDFDTVKRRFPADPVAGKGPPAAYVALAQILEEQRGDERAAAAVIERLGAVHPDDTRSLGLAARWHLGHRDADAAAVALAKARVEAPDDVDLAFLDYQTAMARGDDARAAEILSGPLAAAEPTPQIILARCGYKQRTGDVDGALEILRSALDKQPTEVAFHTAIVSLLADAGRIDDLRRQLDVSRPKLPEKTDVLLFADGLIAMAERRWLQAERCFDELRPRVSRDAGMTRRIDLALAECHRGLGQADRAQEAQDRARGSAGGIPQKLFLDIDELEREGRVDEALQRADMLVETIGEDRLFSSPQLCDRLLRLRVASQLRRPEGERDWSACDALLGALATREGVDPEFVERRRIDVVSAQHGLPAALEASTAALAARPGSPALLAQRALLLAASGDSGQARELLASLPEEALDSPETIDAALKIAAVLPAAESRHWLTDIEARLDRLDDATATRCARQLVAIHFGRGASAEAERIAREAVARDPEDLPLQSVLLDLAAERDDVEAVTRQAEVLTRLTGAESPTAQLAEAVAVITRVRADRVRRLSIEADAVRLSDAEKTDLELAKSRLELAGNQRPRWSDVPRYLAAIDELNDDYGSAIGQLRRASGFTESLPFARRRLAYLLILSGRSEEARPVVQSLGPAAGIALERLRADAVAGAGRPDDARRLGAALTPDDCEDVEQLVWYAGLLARCRQPDDAIRVCRRAIELAPERSGPWMTLVGVHLAADDIPSARAVADEARGRLADEERARFDTAVNVRLTDPETLEAEYRAAVAADPADMEAAKRLTALLIRQRKSPEARSFLEGIVGAPRGGGAPSDWARRALARLIAGDGYRELLDALALLRRTSDPQGRQAAEDIALSIALLTPRNEPSSWRQAVALFDDLARWRPLTTDERVALADLRLRLGKRKEARDALVAIASSPSASLAVKTKVAESFLEDGDPRGARPWVERLRSEAPDAVPTIVVSARLEKAEGNDAAAAEWIRRLLPEAPLTAGNARGLVERALIAESMGFRQEAGRVFEEYARIAPEGRLIQARSAARDRSLAESVDLLDGALGKVSAAAFLETLQAVVRQSSGEIGAETRERIVNWLARVSRENPDSIDVAIQVAALQESLGMSDEAERRYRELLADGRLSRGQRGVVAANLGWILARPEHSEEATDLIDRAVQILGPISELLDTRALVRLAHDQKILALEDIRDALLVPSAQKYLHLAVIQAESGDLESAAAALEEARSRGLADERLSEEDVARLESLESRLNPAAGGS